MTRPDHITITLSHADITVADTASGQTWQAPSAPVSRNVARLLTWTCQDAHLVEDPMWTDDPSGGLAALAEATHTEEVDQ